MSDSDVIFLFFFFFQAEDGIRDHCVTGVQTCALPICAGAGAAARGRGPVRRRRRRGLRRRRRLRPPRRARACRADPRRRPAPEPGDLHARRRVRAPRDLPEPAVIAFTPEQEAVVERRHGSVLVSANAGSGKTSVMVERYVAAVVRDEVAVEALLAITFTEKAAAQLRRRIRARLHEVGAEAAA